MGATSGLRGALSNFSHSLGRGRPTLFYFNGALGRTDQVKKASPAPVSLPIHCMRALSSALSISSGDLQCSLLRCVPRSMPTRPRGIGMPRRRKIS